MSCFAKCIVMLNGWPCWNDSTLLLTRNVKVLQLLCAGSRDKSIAWMILKVELLRLEEKWLMRDYETSERSCIKESHVIEITQSACKITEKKGSRMTWQIWWCFKVLLWAGPLSVYRFSPRNSDCYKMKNQLVYCLYMKNQWEQLLQNDGPSVLRSK